MTDQEARERVAEVLAPRDTGACRDEGNGLVRIGAVLNSQVGGAATRERAAELRALCPGQMLLQTELETAGDFAPDGAGRRR